MRTSQCRRSRPLIMASIGGLGFGLILILCIGSLFLPYDPYAAEPIMANLPPSSSYLELPSDMEAASVRTIVSGVSFSAALHKDGTISVWGDAKDFEGAEALHNIVAIAAGDRHLLASDGTRIYGFGDDEFHQSDVPLHIQEAIQHEGVKKLLASDQYSACISTMGHVFVWGNTRIFDASSDFPLSFQAVDGDASASGMVLIDDKGALHHIGMEGTKLSQLPDNLRQGDIRIVETALSYHNGIALDENGALYAWGEDEGDLLKPPVKDHIKRIAGGRRSFHVLHEDGTVYGWGTDAISDVKTLKGSGEQLLFSDYFQTYAVNQDKISAWGNDGFLLGSDEAGRDVLNRLLHGGLISLTLGMIACILSTCLAVVFGMTSAYLGGWYDHLLTRVMEIITSLPFLPIVISLSAFLMDRMAPLPRMILVMILYGCISWPSLARMIRAKVLAEKQMEYVTAARALGASHMRIMFRHLLPSILPIVLTDFTLMYATTMLMEAGLSFLGFGVPAPYPSWGNMLQSAQDSYVLSAYWWRWVLPAFCVVSSVFCLHLLQEGLRKGDAS